MFWGKSRDIIWEFFPPNENIMLKYPFHNFNQGMWILQKAVPQFLMTPHKVLVTAGAQI